MSQRITEIRIETHRMPEGPEKRVREELLEHIDHQASRCARLQRQLDHLSSTTDIDHEI
jgi:hypothetical protein